MSVTCHPNERLHPPPRALQKNGNRALPPRERACRRCLLTAMGALLRNPAANNRPARRCPSERRCHPNPTSSLPLRSTKSPSGGSQPQVGMVSADSARDQNLQIIFNQAIINLNHISLCANNSTQLSEQLEICVRQTPRLLAPTQRDACLLQPSRQPSTWRHVNPSRGPRWEAAHARRSLPCNAA